MKEHFFIKILNRDVYYKVNYDDVIMIDKWAENSRIYCVGQPYLYVAGEVHEVYKKYFNTLNNFIRSSAYYVVNVDHILSAAPMPDATIELKLQDRHTAILRNAHPYTMFIKKEQMATKKEVQAGRIVHSEAKDELILAGNEDALSIRKLIREQLGESVTTRYIRKRYVELCSH